MDKLTTKYVTIGTIAGIALGVTQMPRQGYDLSQSSNVYQAMGFLLGFASFGAFIGWVSSRLSNKGSN